jgi:hypothetical protein
MINPMGSNVLPQQLIGQQASPFPGLAGLWATGFPGNVAQPFNN